jgi:hypothetical protein
MLNFYEAFNDPKLFVLLAIPIAIFFLVYFGRQRSVVLKLEETRLKCLREIAKTLSGRTEEQIFSWLTKLTASNTAIFSPGRDAPYKRNRDLCIYLVALTLTFILIEIFVTVEMVEKISKLYPNYQEWFNKDYVMTGAGIILVLLFIGIITLVVMVISSWLREENHIDSLSEAVAGLSKSNFHK